MKLLDFSISTKIAETSAPRPAHVLGRPAIRLLLLLALLGGLLLIRENGLAPTLGSRFQTFVTIFLSIFIEAAPFLLAGSIVSGFLELFVNKDMLYRLVPRHPMLAALTGGSLGMIFPVCECGVVPVTRRLYQKGLPLSMGIAFLLAAPVVNPVVVASTYAAFGWGPMLWGRLGLSFLIAVAVGFVFYFAQPEEVLRPDALEENLPDDQAHGHDHHHHHHHQHPADGPPPPQSPPLGGKKSPLSHRERVGVRAAEPTPPQGEARRRDMSALEPQTSRVWSALALAGDDFFDMGRYLVLGSLLAAAMQTLVPQPALLALGGGTVTSIVAMMALAFVLSVCSTVDAFLALAFVNSFTPASILAFLTFGPMVDIKSALMFLGVFKRRTVLYLILLPLLATLLATVFLSLNVRW